MMMVMMLTMNGNINDELNRDCDELVNDDVYSYYHDDDDDDSANVADDDNYDANDDSGDFDNDYDDGLILMTELMLMLMVMGC